MRNKGIRIEYERWVAKKVRKVCTLDRLVLGAEGEEREHLEEEAPRLVSTMVAVGRWGPVSVVVRAKRDEEDDWSVRSCKCCKVLCVGVCTGVEKKR